ncbi:MAG: transposase zinc-binding domain-containing protein, partial [Planctomycetota bacterium]
MGAPCLAPRPVYRARVPASSPLWRLLSSRFDEFERVYDERYTEKYGYWRPAIRKSVEAYLKCGDLHEGFARVRCPQCKHEMFVAYSCKQRCACPSCHQKRALLTAMHVEEEVCSPVAHRQFVFTIPKRFRLYCRYDRTLLGKPARVAWTCGAFTKEGEFLEVPVVDDERILALWEDRVFKLLLKEERIAEDVVDEMRSWEHTGFGFDQSVYLPAGDKAGIKRLMQYMVRCPFS